MFCIRSAVAVSAAVTALVVPAGAAQAAGAVPAAVSLTAPAAGSYGSTISLTGRLWRYGTTAGIGGATVYLQRSPHGRAAWTGVKTARTSASGGYAFAVTQTGAYVYRTVYAGSATYRIAVSPVRYPVTNQKAVLDSVAGTDPVRGTVVVRGRVFPAPPNGTVVQLQRWSADGGVWRPLGTGRTGSGAVAIAANRPAGYTAYRLVVPARAGLGTGVSATVWHRNQVWRPAFVRGLTSVTGGEATLQRSDTVERSAAANMVTWIRFDHSGCSQLTVTTTNHTTLNMPIVVRSSRGDTSGEIFAGTTSSGTVALDPASTSGVQIGIAVQGAPLRATHVAKMLCFS